MQKKVLKHPSAHFSQAFHIENFYNGQPLCCLTGYRNLQDPQMNPYDYLHMLFATHAQKGAYHAKLDKFIESLETGTAKN